MRTMIIGALLALWSNFGFAAMSDRQAATTAPGPAVASTIELRISPIINLHMGLRSVTGGSSGPSLHPMQELEKAIGGTRGWLSFEGYFSGCDTAAQLAEVLKQVPMQQGEGMVRGPAIAYARALAEMEPDYLKGQWLEHRKQLEQAREALQRDLLPHAHACLARIMRSLGMTDSGKVIPVYLTVYGPPPGASTSETADSAGVCFVALDSADGTQFFETILHEATHALDVATRDQQHALNAMRAKLVEAGVPRTDRRWRDTWHTIMFITAADAVRHEIDPKHEDYGVVDKYYDKVPEIAAIERPIWAACLKGEISHHQAIDDIVKAVAAISPKS